ncbi:MAG: hypothetical protein GY875_02995 [Gammaproteobacteria bacterium]|nr:hypothetical protein [Gammaproteobacteria bacterium]
MIAVSWQHADNTFFSQAFGNRVGVRAIGADDGPLASLENSTEADQRIVAEQAILAALRVPPQFSRARLRGEWIERVSSKPRRTTCNWGGIFDRQANRWLRFDDPLGLNQVKWVAE